MTLFAFLYSIATISFVCVSKIENLVEIYMILVGTMFFRFLISAIKMICLVNIDLILYGWCATDFSYTPDNCSITPHQFLSCMCMTEMRIYVLCGRSCFSLRSSLLQCVTLSVPFIISRKDVCHRDFNLQITFTYKNSTKWCPCCKCVLNHDTKENIWSLPNFSSSIMLLAIDLKRNKNSGMLNNNLYSYNETLPWLYIALKRLLLRSMEIGLP